MPALVLSRPHDSGSAGLGRYQADQTPPHVEVEKNRILLRQIFLIKCGADREETPQLLEEKGMGLLSIRSNLSRERGDCQLGINFILPPLLFLARGGCRP